MTVQQGGCLCGKIRFEVKTHNAYAVTCHCKFCQRSTGTAYLVEICFDRSQFTLLSGDPSVHTHVSEGSGKEIYLHFCATCGTKLYLTLERWPDTLNIFNGVFDNTNWMVPGPANSEHLFLDEARVGTVIPAGIRTYRQHNQLLDGTPLEPVIFDRPYMISTDL